MYFWRHDTHPNDSRSSDKIPTSDTQHKIYFTIGATLFTVVMPSVVTQGVIMTVVIKPSVTLLNITSLECHYTVCLGTDFARPKKRLKNGEKAAKAFWIRLSGFG
jgi:hypothetical protein